MVKWSRLPVGREKIALSNPETVGKLQPGDVKVKKEKTSALISDVRTKQTSTEHSRTRSLQELFLIIRSEKRHRLHTKNCKEERSWEERWRYN